MLTLKQKTEVVCIKEGDTDRSVTIRRMAWKPAQEFLAQLAKLLSATGPAVGATAEAPTSSLVSLAARLPELLSQSEALVTHLLRHSTDLDPSQIDQLDTGIVLELVRLAVEINLDAEVKNSCAGIVAVVVGQIPAPAEKTPTT